MDKKDLRIIFLGNPEFAKHHLQMMVEAGYNVVAVISAPDRPAGRGMKLRSTAVTAYARKQKIDCLQPTNLKNADFLKELAAYKADVQIVIAFRMLPVAVWDMPPMGTINLHASLLPQYRGAAPINWAIINGETKTGVTTFKLKHEIDTGNLIVVKECEIKPEETAGSLHDRLMHLGADAILETLDLILKDEVKEFPQQMTDDLKSAPKLFPSTGNIPWDLDGKSITDLILGLNPFPSAHTMFQKKLLKIYKTEFIPLKPTLATGSYATDGKRYLAFACRDGWISVLNAKLEGKRRMDIRDILNGLNLGKIGPDIYVNKLN